ncbi:hypothetical protein [Bradyrhizobium sp.]|uniref:hypothetical protein n=1 Tax=Bradyrhizobium sp. TaxID=376 RepID=UPI003C718438
MSSRIAFELRSIGVIALAATLGGCGLVAQAQQREAYQKALAQVQAGVQICNDTYPKVQNTAVVRAQCIGAATDALRPLLTYPDLYDKEKADRNALAEQWQTGKITQLQYEAQFTEMHSTIVAEEQRRNLANRSVGAQESSASAAWIAAASSPSVVVVPRR